MAIWLWIIVAALAAVGEMLTTGLFLASVALAAVITAVIAIILPDLAWQIGIFAILSALGVAVVRPAALRLVAPPRTMDHAEESLGRSLVDKQGIVIQTVTGESGQIRIGHGEFWTARSFDPADVIPEGTPVQVMLIEGITALVTPLPQSTLETSPELPKGARS